MPQPLINHTQKIVKVADKNVVTIYAPNGTTVIETKSYPVGYLTYRAVKRAAILGAVLTP